MQNENLGQTGRPRYGFTLIELLVVVAIISMLVAVLLPSLSKARKQATAVTCLANMRQSGIVLQQYATENNQFIPINYSKTGASIDWGWNYCMIVADYLKPASYNWSSAGATPASVGHAVGRVVFSCPLSINEIGVSSNFQQGYGLNTSMYYHGTNYSSQYAPTGRLVITSYFSGNSGGYIQGFKTGTIPDPSGYVLLSESFDNWSYTNKPGNPRIQSVWLKRSTNQPIWLRHMEATNALYLDGHGERATQKSLTSDLDGSGTQGYTFEANEY